MPKIQGITSQVRLASPDPVFQKAGSNAEGLAVLGKGIEDVGGQMIHHAKQSAEFDAQLKLTEAKEEWIRNQEAAKANAPVGAEGFTQKTSEEYDTWKDKFLEKNDNMLVSGRLQRGLAELKNSVVKDSLNFESQKQGEKIKIGLVKSEQEHLNRIALNPDKLSEEIDSYSKLVDAVPANSDLDMTAKKMTLDKFKYAAWDSAADAKVVKVTTDPNATVGTFDAAIRALKDKKNGYQDNMTNPAFERALKTLMGGRETAMQKHKMDFVSGFEEWADKTEQTGVDDGKYTPAIIKAGAGSDSKLAEKMIERQAVARGIGSAINEVKDKPDTQIAQELKIGMEDLKGVDSTQFYEKSKPLAAKRIAFEKRMQEWESDQAGYTTKVSKMTGDVFNQFLKQPNKENAELYASTALAEQKRLSPHSQPSLVPKNYAESLQGDFEAAKYDPQGHAKVAERLQAEKEVWGKNFPIVVKDLRAKKVLNDSQYVVANMMGIPNSRMLAEEMLKASNNTTEELSKSVGDTSAKKIQEEVAASLLPFRQSFAATQDMGQEIVGAYERAITNTVMSRAVRNNGFNSRDVKEITNKLINDNYTFTDKYRIPKYTSGRSVDVSAVQRGALQVFRDIPKLKTKIGNGMGLRGEDVQAQDASSLKSFGNLRNDSDNGLRLVDGNGNQVWADMDGKTQPVKWSWSELEAISKDPKTLELQNQERYKPGNVKPGFSE